MQLVDAALQQILYRRCCLDAPVADRNQQRLDVVAQAAHGLDTRHARAALERVQVAFEFLHGLRAAFLDPGQQRLVRGFQQFGGFFRENRRDFGIVFGVLGLLRLRRALRLGRPGRLRRRCRRAPGRRIAGLNRVGQLVDVLDQARVIGAIAIWRVDVVDDRRDRTRGRAHRIEARLLEADLVVVYPSYEAIQCGGNGNAALDVRHVGAAVQRVTGAMQFVRDIEWRPMALAGREVVGDDLDVPGSLLRKDVVQHRVHFERLRRLFNDTLRLLEREHCGIRIAFRESGGARYQKVDIRLRVRADFELLDEFRNRIRRLHDEIHHRRCSLQSVIDQPVEQVLHGPAVFADAFGADHAAAALECVERTPHRDQHFHVIGGFDPRWQVALDRGDLFLGLLDEQLEQFRIEMLGFARDDREAHHRSRSQLLRVALRLCGRQRRRRLGLDLFDGKLLCRRRRRRGVARRRLFHALFDVAQHGETGFGVIEHVPGLAAAGLHRLHVVFDADDGVGQSVRLLLRQHGGTACVQHGGDQAADAIDDLHGPCLVQHQEARLDAADQRRHVVEPGRWRLRSDALADRFLDARQVDDAFAHDRFRDFAELVVRVGLLRRLVRFLHLRQAKQLLFESILDSQQCRSDIENDLFVGDAATFHDAPEATDFPVDVAAQLPEPEYPQRVTDLFQQLELRHEFGRLVHARADEDVEDVLDAAQVLANRRADSPHESCARRRQRFAGIFDLLVARQQFGQVERGADLADAFPGSARAGDVIKQVVDQVVDRVFFEGEQALIDDVLDLPVRLTEQPLDRDRGFETAVTQGLEHAADDPPQLVHVVAGRRMLQRGGNFRQGIDMPGVFAALDPPEQRKLELRSQASRHQHRVFARAVAGPRPVARTGRRKVEQQQGAFRQQRFAARGAQVVEHRQQYQRDIPAAAEQAFDVDRQLHHRARQRVEPVLAPLAGTQRGEEIADVLHLLDEQSGAIGFGHAQRATGLVQQFARTIECGRTAVPVDAIL